MGENLWEILGKSMGKLWDFVGGILWESPQSIRKILKMPNFYVFHCNYGTRNVVSRYPMSWNQPRMVAVLAGVARENLNKLIGSVCMVD